VTRKVPKPNSKVLPTTPFAQLLEQAHKHGLAPHHVMAILILVGIAVSGGYWGAQSLFGASPKPQATQSYTLQQTLSGVILPEPNGKPQHGTRAYEEKVTDSVYEPTRPTALPAGPAPKIAPKIETPPEVASLPPPQETATTQPLWRRNALDFTPPAKGPIIAIVIDDMGVDRKRSKRMWEDVPGPLTLSFMTYANDLPRQTAAAHAHGHELMLHMSMEPSNPDIDAGPNVLMTTMPDAEIRTIANWGMDRFTGFIGVNNHMGSRFTEDPHAMRVVLEQVKKRGLLFLDSRTSPKSVGRRVARELGLPELDRNVFLDNDNEIPKVLKQLSELERLARKRGTAIAIGHPRDATLAALKTWIPNARDRGLIIAPLSTVMKLRIAMKTKRSP